MATQFYALTGKRRAPTYVDEINAQTPYLYGAYRQKKADEYQDKTNQLTEDQLALERERLTENVRSSNLNLDQQAKQLDQQAKQSDRANAISMLGLGGNIYLGVQRNKEMKDLILGESGGSAPSGSVSKTALGVAPEKAAENLPSTSATVPAAFSVDKALTPSTWAEPATSLSTWASGVGGGLVGAELGERVGEAVGVGGKAEQRVVGGALGGFAADRFLAGGDIYSNIFAGLLGGVTGKFSGGWF